MCSQQVITKLLLIQGVWTWNDGRRFEGLFDKDFPVEGVLTEDKAGVLRTQSVQWDRVTHCMVSCMSYLGCVCVCVCVSACMCVRVCVCACV